MFVSNSYAFGSSLKPKNKPSKDNNLDHSKVQS
jgi:hypothetical protein